VIKSTTGELVVRTGDSMVIPAENGTRKMAFLCLLAEVFLTLPVVAFIFDIRGKIIGFW